MTHNIIATITMTLSTSGATIAAISTLGAWVARVLVVTVSEGSGGLVNFVVDDVVSVVVVLDEVDVVIDVFDKTMVEGVRDVCERDGEINIKVVVDVVIVSGAEELGVEGPEERQRIMCSFYSLNPYLVCQLLVRCL